VRTLSCCAPSPATHPRRYRLLTAATATACALLAGCSGLRCPRIDPTGNSCFIWPKDEVITPVGAPLATVPPVAGNPVAPPVTTDPFFPTVPAPPLSTAPATTVVTPASVAVPQVAQDRLSITPQRVLAPVGSEVVLKANICTTDGYTLANQKVEWMLGRNGVGQFVELGGKGLVHPPLIPWFRGSKVDNYLAHGYTADGPLCIDRGTPDPTDDVNINRGDAWISVTSANEGTSHVTAFTPAVENWDLRRADATIYWVDVQWTFPPPSITSSGRETLTTVVTRHTDGTPLEGYIVRYEVADGSAGAILEVRTGPDGRASVVVSPTGGAAASQINVQLVRPANFAGSDAPQLVIATGTTTINWGGSQPYLPPSTTTPAPTIPPAQSAPAPIQQAPITPPPSLPTTAARLEFDVAAPSQAQVGSRLRTTLTIRNVGDAPATNVVVTDDFDAGLIFPIDPSQNKIRNPSIGTIGPRETRTLDIELDVSKAGQLCQRFTVEYAEGQPVAKQVCVNAVAAAPEREARLRVSIDGPAQVAQGQMITFRVVVKNEGQTALVNIRTEEEYPTAILQPQPTDANVDVVSGRIVRTIPRLEVGQQKEFLVPCRTLQATRDAAVIRGRAETDPPSAAIENADEHDFEVVPAAGQPAPGPGAPPAAGAAARSGVVSSITPTINMGARSRIEVTVRNAAQQADSNVALRVYFPPNVTPDPLMAEGPPTTAAPTIREGALVFQPLPSLPAGETVRYVIPISATQPGVVDVIAQAVSKNAPQPISHTLSLEIRSDRR
jgi:uncharacterized repeat protein (TIGR01451 family)